jgi:subtilisin family serine protease
MKEDLMRRLSSLICLAVAFQFLFLHCHTAFSSDGLDRRGPSLRLLLASRPRLPRLVEGSLLQVAAREECSVTIRFNKELTQSDIASLEAQGVKFEKIGGNISRVGTIYGASLPWELIDAVSQRPDVAMIESVWHPSIVPLLDVSAPEIQATEAWEQVDELGNFLTGQGVIIADFDTGVDVFHPHFWRADGDTFQWLDVNLNGVFDPGVDAVDLNKNGLFDTGEILNFFDGQIYDPAHTFGGNGTSNNDGIFQSHWDWLYNDANGNAIRDHGRGAGFDENTSTYGEKLFILVDADSDQVVDPGESLVALGTSKVIATLNTGNIERVRGTDLIDTEQDTNGHGTSVCGILAGGTPGTSRFCGVAPDAEVVVGNFFSDISFVSLLAWARARGASIALYEGASFVFVPLDGSTNEEQALDAASDSMLQVTPAGNLCRGYKHAQVALEPLGSQSLTSYAPNTYSGLTLTEISETLLWRTPSNSISFSLTTPGAITALLLGNGSYQLIGSYWVYSARDTSTRGTVEFDIYIYRQAGVGGNWTLTITSAANSSEEVNAYIADNVTSWAEGAEFTNHRSNDKTICWPATADSAFTLASYSTRGYSSYSGPGGGTVHPGQLSEFSSRGKRIDGLSIMEIAAPGNYDVYSSRSHDDPGATFGGYRQFSGTSAAGPHIAAGAAIVLQASPEFTPAQIKDRITMSAARDTFTGPNYNDSWGFGKIRILDAVAPAIFVAQANLTAPPMPLALRQNFPNPFNPVTTVRYVLPSNGAREKFAIRVFDPHGRAVKTIMQGEWGPGSLLGTASWNGTDEGGRSVSSGIYFIRLEARGISSSVKAVLVR